MLLESVTLAKTRTKFLCKQCGLESPAYYGRCPDCGSWSSLVETIEPRAAATTTRRVPAAVAAIAEPLRAVKSASFTRRPLPIQEFSRVLGGGVVPGSLVLVGGDPGIGKSTLLLQAAAGLASEAESVLYVTAEESAQQIKMRARCQRLHVPAASVGAANELESENV